MFDLYVQAQKAVHTKDKAVMQSTYEEIRSELWKAANERDRRIGAGEAWDKVADRLDDASKGLNFVGEHLGQ